MYKIRRLNNYVIHQHKDWEQHIINKSNVVFNLTDEEFNFLLTLRQEYDYILADNVLCIDRNPSFLKGKINDAFIEDYSSHLNIKFYVLYEYQKVENV